MVGRARGGELDMCCGRDKERKQTWTKLIGLGAYVMLGRTRSRVAGEELVWQPRVVRTVWKVDQDSKSEQLKGIEKK